MDKKIQLPPKTKALIFDIDGTLADTMPTHYKAFRKVLGKYGIDFNEEIFNSFAGVPVGPQMVMMKERFKPENFDPETVAREKEDEYYKSIDQAKPIEIVYNVLIDNHGKMPIGCGTGGDRRIATRTLEVIGVNNKVNALVTADDVENGKPAPDTFLKCAEQLGVEPEHCLVFEDGKPGIEAAKAAGMMVVDVNDYL
ncbi:MAG: beta-phosphoglucomutase family hydrolase [Prolixibacteraceae bacterium]|jgi:beta-phosphoglucomutase family hydrolase|nr:beta-phosphoglucomutase family hydrolase [Prolixibacteraceae bacterium]